MYIKLYDVTNYRCPPGAPFTNKYKLSSKHGSVISNMWDEITYPFPNFNSCTVEVWEFIITHCVMYVITYSRWYRHSVTRHRAYHVNVAH